MKEEWPRNSQFYIPLKEAMKDADVLPTDSGEGIPRQPPRNGFADKEEEDSYWEKAAEIDNDLLNF